MQITVLMPCLNESETLSTCIQEALSAFRNNGIAGEMVIADNGSTDGSQAIAISCGARIVEVAAKGYGNALMGGIAAASGEFIVMGDSDAGVFRLISRKPYFFRTWRSPSVAGNTILIGAEDAEQAMSPSGSVFDSGFVGLMCYFVSNLIVLAAVVFGMEFVTLCTRHHDARAIVARDIADAMAAWDGVWYQRIASDGYSYDPERMSNIAFFPLFPMTARCVAKVTGLRMHDAMLLTSHGFLMAAFWIAGVYLQKRAGPSREPRESQFVLLAMAVYPTTFYLRMSYSESSFLCASLLAMLGMVCRWPTLAIAMIIGVATAARSVGVALMLPFLWHLWCERKSIGRFLCQAALLMPVCVSGLAAFMIFQWQAFGDSLAFVKAHRHWYERIPPESYWDRIVAHVTLEPLWRVYDSTSPCCWSHEPPTGFPLFSMQFMNPIFVLASWIAIGWGAYRRVLSGKEVWLSLGLLAIPYLTHNYRSCCTAEGRLASVIFPFYIVLGSWLSRLPRALSTGLVAIMSVLLAIYTALFIQWYWFY